MTLLAFEASILITLRCEGSDQGSASRGARGVGSGLMSSHVTLASGRLSRGRSCRRTIRSPALAELAPVLRLAVALKGFVVPVRVALGDQGSWKLTLQLSLPMRQTSAQFAFSDLLLANSVTQAETKTSQ